MGQEGAWLGGLGTQARDSSLPCFTCSAALLWCLWKFPAVQVQKLQNCLRTWYFQYGWPLRASYTITTTPVFLPQIKMTLDLWFCLKSLGYIVHKDNSLLTCLVRGMAFGLLVAQSPEKKMTCLCQNLGFTRSLQAYTCGLNLMGRNFTEMNVILWDRYKLQIRTLSLAET